MKMDEGDVFCSNCGTKVEEQMIPQMVPQATPQSAPQMVPQIMSQNSPVNSVGPPKDKYDSFLALKQELDTNRMIPARKRKKRNWIKWVGLSMLLVATVSIALVIVLNTTVYKQKSVEGTVDLLFEAIEDNDIDKYMMLVPYYYQDYMKATFYTYVKNDFKDLVRTYDFEDGIEYEITDIDRLSDSKFNTLKKNLKNWYDVDGVIEDYAKVEIDVGDGEDVYYILTLKLINIDGVWYLAKGYLGN